MEDFHGDRQRVASVDAVGDEGHSVVAVQDASLDVRHQIGSTSEEVSELVDFTIVGCDIV